MEYNMGVREREREREREKIKVLNYFYIKFILNKFIFINYYIIY